MRETMGSLVPHFPWASKMAGELHDNAEQRAFTPAGAESSHLVVSNAEMATFQGVQQGGGVSVADREQALFGNGFDFGQAGNIYGGKDTLAWDPKQAYGDVRQGGLRTDVVRVMAPGITDRAVFPYRGFEDQHLAECTKANPEAWNQAFDSYPNLRQFLSDQDGPKLMQALVRNELHHYDPGDIAGDKQARSGKGNDAETLGYAQITPIGLRAFEQRYPQLKEFLESKGYSGPGHEAKALEDPSCVPMIVGAKLQSIADHYQSSRDKITGAASVSVNARTLAYGYNADVYYNPKSSANPDFHANIFPKAKEIEHLRGYDKAFPTSDERVLSKSAHVQNVESQLKLLR